MHTKRLTITYVALAAALLGLFALNLFWGSVAISPRGVVQALLGRGQDELAANKPYFYHCQKIPKSAATPSPPRWCCWGRRSR